MSVGVMLTILSGIAWTIVYIDGIRIGLKDKTYAMPLWPLGLNIAWELIYFLAGMWGFGPARQMVINGIWFILDIGLFYTYFKYGRKYFPKHLKPVWFYLWAAAAIIVGLVVHTAFLLEFEPFNAATYAAFLQNLLMSVLFIQMLVQRRSREGQTMLIAVSKFIGSLAPTISGGILGGGPVKEPLRFVLIIGLLINVVDLIYIVMLARTKTQSSPGTAE